VIAGLEPPVQSTPLPTVAVSVEAVATALTVHVVPAQVSPAPDDRRVPVMVNMFAFNDPDTSSVPPELVPVPVTVTPDCVSTSVTTEFCGAPPAVKVKVPFQVPLKLSAVGEVLSPEPHAPNQSTAHASEMVRILILILQSSIVTNHLSPTAVAGMVSPHNEHDTPSGAPANTTR
jgi:hypothetical protein